MKPKADLKLVILFLSTPVCFLEGQANVELVLWITQSTVVYNPTGSTEPHGEGKGWTRQHQYHTKPLLRHQAGSSLGTTLIFLVYHTLAMVVAFNQKSEFCLISMDLVELTALPADGNLGYATSLTKCALSCVSTEENIVQRRVSSDFESKCPGFVVVERRHVPPCTLHFLYL